MKTLLVLTAALAALACVLATQEQKAATPVFFRDVPGPPRPTLEEENQGLRIFNGDVAGRTQFPFQAAMYIDLNVFCGGSLIHPKWVLTAAHCVAAGEIWYVFLGVTESMTPRQAGRETFITRGGYPHPKYNARLIINDVGLVQLMRPAALSQYIAVIPLTPANAEWTGRTGTVSGFGRVDDASASPISPVLKFATLPIVDNAVCAAAYGSSANDPSVICLKAEGQSSCKGDSGGPLTVTDNTGRLIQVGAVSFGAKDGCTLGMPVGYTNIAMFIDWLTETTGVDFSKLPPGLTP